jgi:ribosome maturation factor RimP
MAHVDIKHLEDAIRPLVAKSNLVLEEVKVRSAGRRQLVQVIVDSEDALDLDEVASISRAIDNLIEDKGLLGDIAFTLEVTSPGIDRPLTENRHWKKNVGRLVEVTPAVGDVFTARIREVADGIVSFDDGQNLSVDAITTAVVQIEFNRKDKDVAVNEDAEGDAE